MSVELSILSLLLCFAGAAFFAGTETGVLSLNHARLMHLVRSGSKAATLLSVYVSDTQRFLATTLIGTNLMNVVLSTLSARLAHSLFPDSRFFQTAWGVAMAFMVLFFCEYLPKLFFTTRPLRRTLFVSRVFYVAERLLTPLTVLVLFLTKWLVPKSRGASDARFFMSREYIQNVVSDPKDGSRITAFERLMINRVLGLQTRTASQLMTPLDRVSRTSEKATLSACYRLVRDSGHIRLPVFSEDGTRCVGVLNTLDVFASSPDPDRACVSAFMRPPFYVSGDVQADDVLPLMRQNRQPMAMVRNAQGAVLGILTEANVLTELIGNL